MQKMLLLVVVLVVEKNASSAALEVFRHGSVSLNCLFGTENQTKRPRVSFCCFVYGVVAVFLQKEHFGCEVPQL